MKVENQCKVKVEYEGKLEDGSVFDTSAGREPLEFVVGAQMVIPGFNDGLVGMDINEEKEIIITPENGYGPVRQELIQEVEKKMLGEDLEAKVGVQIGLKAPTGQIIPATIIGVTEDKIKIDLNPPLAGKTLTFKVKLVDCTKLTEQEIEEMKKAQSCAPSQCSDEKCHEC